MGVTDCSDAQRLARALSLRGQGLTLGAGAVGQQLAPYADGGGIAAWGREAAAAAAQLGLMTGRSATTHAPLSNARAEAVVIFRRMLTLLGDLLTPNIEQAKTGRTWCGLFLLVQVLRKKFALPVTLRVCKFPIEDRRERKRGVHIVRFWAPNPRNQGKDGTLRQKFTRSGALVECKKLLERFRGSSAVGDTPWGCAAGLAARWGRLVGISGRTPCPRRRVGAQGRLGDFQATSGAGA